MKHARAGEYFALVVAALVLLVVLISSFMCIQLYRLRKPEPHCGVPSYNNEHPRQPTGTQAPREPFLGNFDYSPSCNPLWSGYRHGECHGFSTGAMPSIEVTRETGGDRLCSGLLGVPP
jgi:hypothetical protein